MWVKRMHMHGPKSHRVCARVGGLTRPIHPRARHTVQYMPDRATVPTPCPPCNGASSHVATAFAGSTTSNDASLHTSHMRRQLPPTQSAVSHRRHTNTHHMPRIRLIPGRGRANGGEARNAGCQEQECRTPPGARQRTCGVLCLCAEIEILKQKGRVT